MLRFRFRRSILVLSVIGALASALGAQSSQVQVAADAQRFIKALDIRPGSVVAEIGAGDGELTVELARHVGDQGRVFSNELNPTKVKAIAALAEQRSLGNVTTIEGHVTESGLPVQCCDAIAMRDVYHHFSDPAAMDKNLLASLKPGGKVGILEFTPPGAESPDPAHRGDDGQHGVYSATVERELKAAGFEAVSTQVLSPRTYLTIARRPALRSDILPRPIAFPLTPSRTHATLPPLPTTARVAREVADARPSTPQPAGRLSPR